MASREVLKRSYITMRPKNASSGTCLLFLPVVLQGGRRKRCGQVRTLAPPFSTFYLSWVTLAKCDSRGHPEYNAASATPTLLRGPDFVAASAIAAVAAVPNAVISQATQVISYSEGRPLFGNTNLDSHQNTFFFKEN